MRGGAVMVTGFLWLRLNLFFECCAIWNHHRAPNMSVMKCTNGRLGDASERCYGACLVLLSQKMEVK